MNDKPMNPAQRLSTFPAARTEPPDYRRAYHALSAPCAILDRDFRFVDMNQVYLDTLKANREGLLGKRVLDAFPETGEHQKVLTVAFDKALAGEDASLNEIEYAIADASVAGGMRHGWWNAHFSPLINAQDDVTHVLLRVSDITDQVKSRELKDAIAGETQHRIGNLMAIVTSIARQSARGQSSLADFLTGFEARIHSLAKTHSLLTGGNWNGMTMDRVIHQQLDAFADRMNSTVFVEGPDLPIMASDAQSLSMALHELATNAAKHGALSQEGGRLKVSWAGLEAGFEFEWMETGMTGVTEPTKSGFGTMFLTSILPSQLNGKATREFTPDSYRYRLRVERRTSG